MRSNETMTTETTTRTDWTPQVGELAYESGSWSRGMVVIARTPKRALVVLAMKSRKRYQVRWLPVTGYAHILRSQAQGSTTGLALAVAGLRSRVTSTGAHETLTSAPWVTLAVARLRTLRGLAPLKPVRS
jgi:hypothetical protein